MAEKKARQAREVLTGETITVEQLEALQLEARERGDAAMVAICETALGGTGKLPMVVTYDLVWQSHHKAALCAKHDNDPRFGSLGQVSQGAHRGLCGACEDDRNKARAECARVIQAAQVDGPGRRDGIGGGS